MMIEAAILRVWGQRRVTRKYKMRHLEIDTNGHEDCDIQHMTDDMEHGRECEDDAGGKDAKYHTPLTRRQLDPPKHAQR